MLYCIAADAVAVIHFAFVVFVPFGALLALKWHWIPWLHLPAATWGLFLEVTGRACPLTDLEKALRSLTGESAYAGGFIEHYLVTPISPGGLTKEAQVVLLVLVIATNVLSYGWLHVRRFRSQEPAA
ncbi:MAG TPA: DUF2784 domain-containing protein [Burkholderiaceae bacterium]|nr:DUF2784 domain-containing protein [Burkholderiaceae bacterium]